MAVETLLDIGKNRTALAGLEGELIAKPDDHKLIRRYFDVALSSQQIEHAKIFFQTLLKSYPNHHQLRTLYISLCLQSNDNHAAMKAIEYLIAFSEPDDALLDAALRVREKIGPKTVPIDDDGVKRLSVCMIVRDEQRYLASCLSSIKKIAAEIVLVDTGSEDRSVDIARIFGARVYHFQWQDDFAAARNAGLEKAEGDWILVLDADEMIAEQDHAELKRMLCDHHTSSIAFSIVTRNYTHNANTINWHANDGSYPCHEAGIGWFPSNKIRLFPNNRKICFQFPVHELVDPLVRSAGCTVSDCLIPIHHYGHLNEAKNRKKAETYFHLGYAKLEQLGEDVGAIRELAVQAGQLELWAESLELWRRLLDIRPDFVEAFVNMSGASWQIARYQEAIEYAKKALDLQPGLKEASYNLAVSHLMLGRAKDAFVILRALYKTAPEYLAAKFMAAAAAVCMDEYEDGVTVLKELETSSLGKALPHGIQDLIRRMRDGGRDDEAAKLDCMRKSLYSQEAIE